MACRSFVVQCREYPPTQWLERPGTDQKNLDSNPGGAALCGFFFFLPDPAVSAFFLCEWKVMELLSWNDPDKNELRMSWRGFGCMRQWAKLQKKIKIYPISSKLQFKIMQTEITNDRRIHQVFFRSVIVKT